MHESDCHGIEVGVSVCSKINSILSQVWTKEDTMYLAISVNLRIISIFHVANAHKPNCFWQIISLYGSDWMHFLQDCIKSGEPTTCKWFEKPKATNSPLFLRKKNYKPEKTLSGEFIEKSFSRLESGSWAYRRHWS